MFHYSMAKLGNMLEEERRERFKIAHECPRSVFLAPKTGGRKAVIRTVNQHRRVEADALITTTRRLALEILPADCPIVVLMDPESGTLAMLHGSRDALERGVVRRTLNAWRRRADLSSTAVVISPHIRTCCHRFPLEIALKVLRRWPREFGFLTGVCGEDRFYAVDYERFLKAELEGARQVFTLGDCTCCAKTEDGRHKFHSHRRSVVEGTGKERAIALAWFE